MVYLLHIEISVFGGGDMQWEEVREKFSNEWVVFEAINAYSKDGFRCMDSLMEEGRRQ